MQSHVSEFAENYQTVRHKTTELCAPLQIEDYVIQGNEDVSPPKWHLAHTTWFFETFILLNKKNYAVFDPAFQHLFNSYYYSLGQPYPRVQRGLLARPTVETVYAYRKHIDELLIDYLTQLSQDQWEIFAPLLTLGLQHEQQHQELLLMDIKYNFSLDAYAPQYNKKSSTAVKKNHPTTFADAAGGIVEIGHKSKEFCFDNELPSHQCILKPYKIAKNVVTNGEYLEFIQAGGYTQPEWWLADGWDWIIKNHCYAPLYWQKIANTWHIFTLNGLQEIDLNEPVVHVNFYEADAYARWKNCRLPTEIEWEHYAAQYQQEIAAANFLENDVFHPTASAATNQQLFGDVWEWTASSYHPYPGFKPFSGVVSEYNGKFMSNQMVLRGGCCITPRAHLRISYRNFYAPEKRWQFSGIRLAKD